MRGRINRKKKNNTRLVTQVACAYRSFSSSSRFFLHYFVRLIRSFVASREGRSEGMKRRGRKREKKRARKISYAAKSSFSV